MGRRRDAERGLDHAAEHDEHAVGPGRVDHLQRAPYPAALGELDVDPADVSGERWHVSRIYGTLVCYHGHGGSGLGHHAQGFGAGRGRDGLFDHADPDLLQLRHDLDGLFGRERLVGVDPEIGPRCSSHRPERLDVLPSPDFDLEDRVLPQPLRFGNSRLSVGYAQRVGGDGFGFREPEQAVDGHAEPLRREVVHGVVERRERRRGKLRRCGRGFPRCPRGL